MGHDFDEDKDYFRDMRTKARRMGLNEFTLGSSLMMYATREITQKHWEAILNISTQHTAAFHDSMRADLQRLLGGDDFATDGTVFGPQALFADGSTTAAEADPNAVDLDDVYAPRGEKPLACRDEIDSYE